MYREKIIFIVLIFVFLSINRGHAAVKLAEPEIAEAPEYILYIPSGIYPDRKYPLVIALSPAADAQSMIELWIGISERHKWIIFASKEFKNGVDMGPLFERLMATAGALSTKFPIDPYKVIAAGVSGGGMGAHALAFLYPKPVRAVIVNTGIINDYFIEKKDIYPRAKLVVFLASPADFRYEDMKKNRKFLENLKWKVKWLEFEGGHVAAPASVYKQAADWLNNELK